LPFCFLKNFHFCVFHILLHHHCWSYRLCVCSNSISHFMANTTYPLCFSVCPFLLLFSWLTVLVICVLPFFPLIHTTETFYFYIVAKCFFVPMSILYWHPGAEHTSGTESGPSIIKILWTSISSIKIT
jgi:hypothetical protein